MKIYLSCPISRNARHSAEIEILASLAAHKWPDAEIVNPLNIGACPDGVCGGKDLPGGHTWQCFMRYDVAGLVHCDVVLVRENYTESKGCMAEVRVAWDLGIPVVVANVTAPEPYIYRTDAQGVPLSVEGDSA